MILKRGMDRAVEEVIKQVQKLAKKIPANDVEQVAQVANISAADEQIGQMIAEAIKEAVKTNNAAVIDAFHDVLVDQLYEELLARQKVQQP